MSKEKKPVDEQTQQTAPDETPEAHDNAAPAEQSAPQEDWKTKYEDINDRFLRLAAEFDNFRKRSQREQDSVYAKAVAKTVTELLPTYDNLERAVKAETTDPEYKKGIEMTMTQFEASLKKLDVESIGAAPGTVFDPNLHNAVMHIEDENMDNNVIAEVFQQGFRIGDRVVRHAMVKVAN